MSIMHQALGDVIAIALSLFTGLGLAKGFSGFIEHQAGEQEARPGIGGTGSISGIARKDALHGVPCCLIDDGLVLSGIGFSFVGNLSDIERVGKKLVEIAAGERFAAGLLTVFLNAMLGGDAEAVGLFLEFSDRAQFDVEVE